MDGWMVAKKQHKPLQQQHQHQREEVVDHHQAASVIKQQRRRRQQQQMEEEEGAEAPSAAIAAEDQQPQPQPSSPKREKQQHEQPQLSQLSAAFSSCLIDHYGVGVGVTQTHALDVEPAAVAAPAPPSPGRRRRGGTEKAAEASDAAAAAAAAGVVPPSSALSSPSRSSSGVSHSTYGGGSSSSYLNHSDGEAGTPATGGSPAAHDGGNRNGNASGSVVSPSRVSLSSSVASSSFLTTSEDATTDSMSMSVESLAMSMSTWSSPIRSIYGVGGGGGGGSASSSRRSSIASISLGMAQKQDQTATDSASGDKAPATFVASEQEIELQYGDHLSSKAREDEDGEDDECVRDCAESGSSPDASSPDRSVGCASSAVSGAGTVRSSRSYASRSSWHSTSSSCAAPVPPPPPPEPTSSLLSPFDHDKKTPRTSNLKAWSSTTSCMAPASASASVASVNGSPRSTSASSSLQRISEMSYISPATSEAEDTVDHAGDKLRSLEEDISAIYREGDYGEDGGRIVNAGADGIEPDSTAGTAFSSEEDDEELNLHELVREIRDKTSRFLGEEEGAPSSAVNSSHDGADGDERSPPVPPQVSLEPVAEETVDLPPTDSGDDDESRPPPPALSNEYPPSCEELKRPIPMALTRSAEAILRVEEDEVAHYCSSSELTGTGTTASKNEPGQDATVATEDATKNTTTMTPPRPDPPASRNEGEIADAKAVSAANNRASSPNPPTTAVNEPAPVPAAPNPITPTRSPPRPPNHQRTRSDDVDATPKLAAPLPPRAVTPIMRMRMRMEQEHDSHEVIFEEVKEHQRTTQEAQNPNVGIVTAEVEQEEERGNAEPSVQGTAYAASAASETVYAETGTEISNGVDAITEDDIKSLKYQQWKKKKRLAERKREKERRSLAGSRRKSGKDRRRRHTASVSSRASSRTRDDDASVYSVSAGILCQGLLSKLLPPRCGHLDDTVSIYDDTSSDESAASSYVSESYTEPTNEKKNRVVSFDDESDDEEERRRRLQLHKQRRRSRQDGMPMRPLERIASHDESETSAGVVFDREHDQSYRSEPGGEATEQKSHQSEIMQQPVDSVSEMQTQSREHQRTDIAYFIAQEDRRLEENGNDTRSKISSHTGTEFESRSRTSISFKGGSEASSNHTSDRQGSKSSYGSERESLKEVGVEEDSVRELSQVNELVSENPLIGKESSNDCVQDSKTPALRDDDERENHSRLTSDSVVESDGIVSSVTNESERPQVDQDHLREKPRTSFVVDSESEVTLSLQSSSEREGTRKRFAGEGSQGAGCRDVRSSMFPIPQHIQDILDEEVPSETGTATTGTPEPPKIEHIEGTIQRIQARQVVPATREQVEFDQVDMHDRNFIKKFVAVARTSGIPLLFHAKHIEKTFVQPTRVNVYLRFGMETRVGGFSEPKLVWGKDGSDQRGFIELFDIRSLDKASVMDLEAYPLAVPGRSLIMRTNRDECFAFEALNERGALRFVHGMRWVVARLTFNCIIGNMNGSCELMDIDEAHGAAPVQGHLVSQQTKAMNDVTNHLVDKASISTGEI